MISSLYDSKGPTPTPCDSDGWAIKAAWFPEFIIAWIGGGINNFITDSLIIGYSN